MTLDASNTIDIIEIMEQYLSKVRPEPEIRHKIDLNYEIDGQSVILNEIRPAYKNPQKILVSGYAKATYVKSKNCWKIYWKRADNKWHPYDEQLTVRKLKDFLNLVDQDPYGCFKG